MADQEVNTTHEMTVRELTVELKALGELTREQLKALKQFYDERHKTQIKALTLQAKEYERRLDALNHENARIIAIQAKSVSTEVYEAQQLNLKQALDLQAREYERRIDEMKTDFEKYKESQAIEIRSLREYRAGEERSLIVKTENRTQSDWASNNKLITTSVTIGIFAIIVTIIIAITPHIH